MNHPVESPRVDVLVREYLHGNASLEESIQKIPKEKPRLVDYALRVLLPDDLFRRILMHRSAGLPWKGERRRIIDESKLPQK